MELLDSLSYEFESLRQQASSYLQNKDYGNACSIYLALYKKYSSNHDLFNVAICLGYGGNMSASQRIYAKLINKLMDENDSTLSQYFIYMYSVFLFDKGAFSQAFELLTNNDFTESGEECIYAVEYLKNLIKERGI